MIELITLGHLAIVVTIILTLVFMRTHKWIPLCLCIPAVIWYSAMVYKIPDEYTGTPKQVTTLGEMPDCILLKLMIGKEYIFLLVLEKGVKVPSLYSIPFSKELERKMIKAKAQRNKVKGVIKINEGKGVNNGDPKGKPEGKIRVLDPRQILKKE